jgi:hypothetical protein
MVFSQVLLTSHEKVEIHQLNGTGFYLRVHRCLTYQYTSCSYVSRRTLTKYLCSVFYYCKYEGKSVNKSQKAMKKILSEIFT